MMLLFGRNLSAKVLKGLLACVSVAAVAASSSRECEPTHLGSTGDQHAADNKELLVTSKTMMTNQTQAATNSTAARSQAPSPPICSLYMARSAIPGAGLGVFTGIDVAEGDTLSTEDDFEDAWFQDLLIPILDQYKTIPYRGHQRFLSWLGYVWPTHVDAFHHSYSDGAFPRLSAAFYPTPQGLNGADQGLYYFYYSPKYFGRKIPINVFAPGLASMVNSNYDWANVGLLEKSITLNWETGHEYYNERRVDPLDVAQKSSSFTRLAPGSGFVAHDNIAAGTELLIYYGDTWHDRHEEKLELQQQNSHNDKGIPDHNTLDYIMEHTGVDFDSLPSETVRRSKEIAMNQQTASKKDKLDRVDAKRRQAVEDIVPRAKKATIPPPPKDGEPTTTFARRTSLESHEKSSTLVFENHAEEESLVVEDEDEDDDEDEAGVTDDEEEPPMRDIRWLQEHGTCLDNLRVGKSTIPEAGRGAFATRFVPENSVLAPAPLLALKRSDLIIFKTDEDSSTYQNTLNFNEVMGRELLLNYCYGHPESDLLLVPYSPVVNFINHNRDLSKVNAEIRWPDQKRAQELLRRSPSEWLEAHPLDVTDQSGQLLMEFVTLRDIQPGEEIFVNYGASWQSAWEEHQETRQDDDSSAFRHEIGVPDGFFPSNWLNQLVDYEIAPIEHLQPGEVRQLTWKHNGQPVAKTAFVVGLPENFTQHVMEFAEERGIVNLYEQLLAENVLDSDEWYVFDADQHEGPAEQWFAQRYRSDDWDFNMHYVSAWDETARHSVFQTFGSGGYDQVLNGIGTYFGLDNLTCFHASFMGVSEADKSFMHADIYGTGEVGYNIIFPLITVDGSNPELDVQSDNGDIVVPIKYEHDRAVVMSDYGYHRTSAVNYEEKGQIRIVLGMYVAQIDETNRDFVKYLYYLDQPAPFMDQFEPPIEDIEIHWDKTGKHRLPK